MSSSYESSRSRRRGVWSHWVPLVVTLTVATVGVAAWAWSQRSNENEEEESDPEPADLDYENADYGENPPYGAYGRESHPPPGANRGSRDDVSYGVGEIHPEATGASAGWGSQVSAAVRRTPSPQQFLQNASKTVAASMAGVGSAVGSAMGSALAAIREEDKNAYADHETWSEEAEARKEKSPPSQAKDPSRRRKTVAIVVSADTNMDNFNADDFHEHASVLSHIPRNTDFAKIKLFILIYAPGIKETALEGSTGNLPPASLSSSFSNIGNEQAHTPGEEVKSPLLSSNTANTPFNAVYSQALALVEKETMIIPFTTPAGHVHILRHLQPEVIYLQESLAGEDGNVITQLQTWLKYDVILIVGADGGHGGLADSESEAEKPEKEKKKEDLWWQRVERVGRGRGVVVVDSMKVGDDWGRRVQGKE
ncbi:hypothetical protein F4821DRAFT_227312 [Hypoxylon rubiginosum]|uniref:Uncharacterized protein n=1 Tax=Hypoxylon rubiginosum TaxID=110542 RepID=A0ACC0DES8_9PEZI|nr:hypothetical protein F4821DRAFT_227312 [Hypoxylon rubiginosum]